LEALNGRISKSTPNFAMKLKESGPEVLMKTTQSMALVIRIKMKDFGWSQSGLNPLV
jgi:hypothetical protein